MIFSFALFCVVEPSLECSCRVLNEEIIFPTELFTELMLPIICSTAADACVTQAAWDRIIFSRESILELIWFTAPAVSLTEPAWVRIWLFTLSILEMISVIELEASCVLTCRLLSAEMSCVFEFCRLVTIPWSFSTKELNPFTTSPISSWEVIGIRLVKSAFPLAISLIESFTKRSGFTSIFTKGALIMIEKIMVPRMIKRTVLCMCFNEPK